MELNHGLQILPMFIHVVEKKLRILLIELDDRLPFVDFPGTAINRTCTEISEARFFLSDFCLDLNAGTVLIFPRSLFWFVTQELARMAEKRKGKVVRSPRVPKAINLGFSLIGILLSSYSLYVELRKEADPSYRPMCDLHEHVSCSKAFMSE